MSFSTSILRAARSQAVPSRRCLHATSLRRAITELNMPAMSPTMTEGGISSWKKAEGEAFTAGDVLLEIETDKATIDVEAQDDGIMGKILAPDGTKGVPVGKVIALLAEEGDDISNLEIPKESFSSSSSSSAPAPSPPKQEKEQPQAETVNNKKEHANHHPVHSKPLFPSVQRLLVENNVEDPEKIKGTGVRGMLTKGDVLAFLGKASSPTGSDNPIPKSESIVAGKKPVAPEPLDGAAIRRLIVSSMLQKSLKARSTSLETPGVSHTYDSIIADYTGVPLPSPRAAVPAIPAAPKKDTYLDGLV